MAHDNIEIVDRDYVQCSKEDMPRQIRTRRSSFNSIFSKFRKKLYERKMNSVIDRTLSSTYTEDEIGKKLLISSERIAALENKIKRLSKDDVPTRFVKRRAIKLRKHMMDNALRNSEGLYMIDLNKEELMNFDQSAVNSTADVESIIPDVVDINNENIQSVEIGNNPVDDFVPDTVESSDEQSIDLSSNGIDKESIGNLINDEFNSLENNNAVAEEESVTKFVSPEEVSMVVGNNPSIENVTTDGEAVEDAIQDIQTESDDVNEQVSSPVVIEEDNGIEEVSNPVIAADEEFSFEETADKNDPVVETHFENDLIDDDPVNEVEVKAENTIVEDPVSDVIVAPEAETVQNFVDTFSKDVKSIDINLDDIKKEINDVLSSIKVDKSEASVAKVDKFDENGNIRFRDHYTPMTDEEIQLSQQKINDVPKYVEKPYVMPSGSIFEKKVTFDNLFVPAKDVQFSFEHNDENKNEERDVPLVVFSRDSVKEAVSSVDNDDLEEYAFDLVEGENPKVDVKTETPKKSSSSRIEEISKLKERVLKLKRRREEANKNMAAAQNSAVETARRAREIKEQADEVREVLDRKYEEFKSYCDGLEKNCDEADKELGLIESDIQMNNNFIEQQRGLVSENNRIIDEIDMIISENHSHSR